MTNIAPAEAGELQAGNPEVEDLLSALDRHRGFLRRTTAAMSDDQARATPTASALSLGGIVKHVTSMERQWAAFVQRGPAAFAWDGDEGGGDHGSGVDGAGDADRADGAPAGGADAQVSGGATEPAAGPVEDPWLAGFIMTTSETLAGLLADYADAARETTAIVRSLPSLDVAHPLPRAPWFEAGATWTARRVLVHLLAETSQHAGHADIIRETIDGAKTMG